MIGRGYYEWCAQILHDLEEADEVRQRRAAKPARPASRLLPPGHRWLCRAGRHGYLARYPNVSVDLRTGTSRAGVALRQSSQKLAVTLIVIRSWQSL